MIPAFLTLSEFSERLIPSYQNQSNKKPSSDLSIAPKPDAGCYLAKESRHRKYGKWQCVLSAHVQGVDRIGVWNSKRKIVWIQTVIWFIDSLYSDFRLDPNDFSFGVSYAYAIGTQVMGVIRSSMLSISAIPTLIRITFAFAPQNSPSPLPFRFVKVSAVLTAGPLKCHLALVTVKYDPYDPF